ncbi:MAG: alpha/beta hydrolase [Magnetovibrio sp.]|nr:alpha/beta hydrolase [Magnetovibrio sp.]|tara:strand:- start:5 stop:637 length:633 start_codon:yes stop_codon:yes gene_type:complete
MTKIIFNGSKNTLFSVALAHGSGAPMDTQFMTFFAEGLAKHGARVARFEFPYMSERRISGKKTLPNKIELLIKTWHQVIDEIGHEKLIIGGKSLGGRVASMIADEANVLGLVCLGYPFHPFNRPDKLRISHLERLKTPSLFLQGDRDSFGNKDEISGYTISDNICFHWLVDGDHSFKPRRRSDRSKQQNLDDALDAFVNFIQTLHRNSHG